MLNLWRDGKHVIGRIQVHCPDAVRSAAQLRLPALLQTIDFQPASLSPSAILCIRQLTDPRPGTISLGHDQLRPPRAWADALQTSIDRLGRTAARPWRGKVPAGAEAVLFADYSEMLACLACEWSEGGTVSRWWWKRLLPTMDMPRGLIETWISAAEYAPAAFDLLSQSGAALPFVSRLASRESTLILDAVVTRHHLPGVREALLTRSQRAPAESAGTDSPTHSPPYSQTMRPNRSSPPPWHEWAPAEASAPLNVEQHALLGVSLTLSRQPQIARSFAFGIALAGWIRSTELSAQPLPSGSAVEAQSIESEPPETTDEASVDRPQSARSPQTNPLPLDSSAHPTAASHPTPPPPRITNPRGTSDPPELTTCPATTERPTPLDPAPRLDLIPEPEPVDRIDTQFGGVFYLVNLALYMEVYGDFTRPADPGLSLVLWDFLALLGLELCGPEITADPLWDFLAHLSSRDPADPPGAGWTAPDGSSAGEWISAFAVGASERLRLALGLSESDDPGRFLCRHTATVMATATHLHIYLSLATLPISIRYAGLDRDPGWVPAGGLYIAFHFD